MPVLLGDGWSDRAQAGNWQLPGEPPFATSRALELLLRDLRRYVRGDIAGRSFLIAGHRGAGKTATITQALRMIRKELLVASVEEPRVGRDGRLQRPLMVKLIGKSLIAPLPKINDGKNETAAEGAGGKPESGAAAGGNGAAGAEGGKPNGAGAAQDDVAKGKEDGDDKPHDEVQAALVHITIALYRALAHEVSEAFAAHAQTGPLRRRRERVELAAQLALDLDGTPEPGALRDYWCRLGRLRDGVLWPSEADDALHDNLIEDQGLRELVAVATAAQAFQVCSGAITYKVTSQDSASKESKVETSIDVKDLVNRIGAIGAGGFAGGAVAATATAPAGVATGILVWLLSTFILKWSGSRSRKAERTLNYTFLRDRSIQTLDRDLPLVIGRIRDAGLAPVFVIDELDKLEQQEKTVADIIKRLKHLVTDYGFFCFLTNRDYFDVIEDKIAKEAYPREHTYFGERVLVLNRPLDLFDYVASLADLNATQDSSERLRIAVFALAVMFRSKLNFTDLSREIDRLTGPDNALICSDQDLQAPGRFRLEATIQLAINEILMSEEVVERFRSDPGFVQLAIDALYYIPRRWQEDSGKPVDIGQGALIPYLLNRRRERQEEAKRGEQAAERPAATQEGEAAKPAEAAAAADAEAAKSRAAGAARRGAGKESEREDEAGAASGLINSTDQQELVEMVARMAGFLANFRTLRAALSAKSPAAPAGKSSMERRRLAEIVVVEKKQLLRRIGKTESTRYRFRLDELARSPDHKVAAAAQQQRKPGEPAARAVKDVGAAPEKVAQAAATPLQQIASKELLDKISELLSVAELSLADLVANGLLPPTLTDGALDATRADVKLAELNPTQSDVVTRALDGLLAFSKAFDGYGPGLAEALTLLPAAAKDAGTTATPGFVLGRISPYLGGPIIGVPRRPDMPPQKMAGTAESVGEFVARFRDWREALRISNETYSVSEARRQGRWTAWRGHVTDFLRRRTAAPPVAVHYADLVLAAGEDSPGRLFARDLGGMDQIDWSRCALEALLPSERPDGPYWLLFGALVALDFDFLTLERIAQVAPPKGVEPPSPEQLNNIFEIVRHARPRPEAVLHVYRDEALSLISRDIPAAGPMLSVAESQVDAYLDGLNWLIEQGVLIEGRYED